MPESGKQIATERTVPVDRPHRQAVGTIRSFMRIMVPSPRNGRQALIVTLNKPFGRLGEVFGDDVVAAAMIDRRRTADEHVRTGLRL
jgi:hypothetical protein